jgi:hypothetical protein
LVAEDELMSFDEFAFPVLLQNLDGSLTLCSLSQLQRMPTSFQISLLVPDVGMVSGNSLIMNHHGEIWHQIRLITHRYHLLPMKLSWRVSESGLLFDPITELVQLALLQVRILV